MGTQGLPAASKSASKNTPLRTDGACRANNDKSAFPLEGASGCRYDSNRFIMQRGSVGADF
jgi:hypothetical protein